MPSALHRCPLNPLQKLFALAYDNNTGAHLEGWDWVLVCTEWLCVLSMYALSDVTDCITPAMAAQRIRELIQRTRIAMLLLENIDLVPGLALKLTALSKHDRVEVHDHWQSGPSMPRERRMPNIHVKAAYGALGLTASCRVPRIASLKEISALRFSRMLETGVDGLSVYHACVLADHIEARCLAEVRDELERTIRFLSRPLDALQRLTQNPYSFRDLMREFSNPEKPWPEMSAHETLRIGRSWDMAERSVAARKSRTAEGSIQNPTLPGLGIESYP